MNGRVLLFLAVSAGSFTATLPNEAEAYGMRVHAFECIAINSDGVSARDQWTNNDQGDELQSTYDSNSEGPRFACPILGTDANPISTLTTAEVYVYDGSTIDGVNTQACVVSPSGGVKSCGSLAASVNGANTLTPGLTQWAANGSSFGYIYVKLPSAMNIDGSAASAIRGIKVHD